jgi:putative membrane protein
MTKFSFPAAALLAFGFLAVPLGVAQTSNDPAVVLKSLSAVTKAADFVNNASYSDKFEIDSSNLAHGNTTNKAVMEFAKQMIDDHSKASTELRNAAKADGLNVTPPPALDARHQAMIDVLTPLKNDEFDDKYIEFQTQAHKEGVTLFTAYATNGDRPELKAFAAKTLPTLQHHLDMISGVKP